MSIRSRSRGQFVPAAQYYEVRRQTTCSENNWVNNLPLSRPLVGVVETMIDNVVPSFHRRVAKGEVFFNDMTHVKTTSSEGSGMGHYVHANAFICTPPWHGEWKCDSNMFAGMISGPNAAIPVGEAISQSDLADLQTEVSTSCLAKRGTSDQNLFEDVAQLNQTVNMFRHPFSNFARFFNKNGRKIMRLDPAVAWLSYRYGIRPLISDISTVLSGLDKYVGNVRRTTRAKESTTSYALANSTKAFGVCSVSYQIQTSDSVTVRAMSLDEYVIDTGMNIGFTGKGLLTLPWELVPYSFVADWFVNVQDYLNALIPLPSFKQLGSCLVTERVQQTVYSTLSTTNSNPATYTIDRGITGTCSASKISKTRVGLSVPGLVIKSDFRLDSATRAADSIALIKQRLDVLFHKRR